jgi:large subunit ribosomal protein L9
MEVILKEEVPHLGQIGDIVKVRPGYARNYLIPRGLATVADRRNLRVLEHERRLVEAKRKQTQSAAETLAQRLAGITVSIAARAGEEGKLFGSVTNLDIERALAEAGVAVERRRSRLDEPIKTLGDHQVSIGLALGVQAEVTVRVIAVGET